MIKDILASLAGAIPHGREALEAAQNLSKQYSHTKDGLRQFLQERNISQGDLESMLKKLDDPKVSRFIDRIPGAKQILREMGSGLLDGRERPRLPASTQGAIPRVGKSFPPIKKRRKS